MNTCTRKESLIYSSGYGHFANFLTTKQKEKPYWLLLLFLLQVFFGDGQH